MKDWETALQSRGAFYILCADTAILASLITDACRFPIRGGNISWTMKRDLGKVMRIVMMCVFDLIILSN